MNAVLGVDLEALLCFFSHNLIDPRRTITLRRFRPLRQVGVQRDVAVRQLQVNRLVFLMIGVGQIDGTVLVEGQYAVGFGVVDWRDFTAFLEGGMIPGVILQSEGHFAAQPVLINVVKGSADIRPELVERWPKVACRLELWIEPGKSVVGNTGILISKVTGIKNSYKKFIGLDAGMETLMRPALYNAHHRIYKIGCPEAETTQTVDFTGRICENTDRLAIDRKFTDIDEGDLVAIMDVGAYGFTMSHQFCTRPKAAEILLDGDKSTLIRERESIEDLFSKCEVY